MYLDIHANEHEIYTNCGLHVNVVLWLTFNLEVYFDSILFYDEKASF